LSTAPNHAFTALPRPVAQFQEPTSKGTRKGRKGRRRERDGKGEERKKWKGRRNSGRKEKDGKIGFP